MCKARKQNLISQERLHELFYYDESDKKQPLVFKKPHAKYKAGDRLGCPDTKGYYKTQLDGKWNYIHRLVYIFHHGSIDLSKSIDHLDNDRANNLIDNLRLVTPSQNSRNKKIVSNNDYVGVSYDKTNDRWRASIRDDNKDLVIKTFSSKKLGHEVAFEKALALRKIWEKRYGYTHTIQNI